MVDEIVIGEWMIKSQQSILKKNKSKKRNDDRSKQR